MPLTYLVDYLNECIRQRPFRVLPDHPLVQRDGRVVGRFATFELDSAFQPIFSSDRNRRVIAHEGLLRARTVDGRSLAPEALLAAPASPRAVVYLDRLCRTVHMLNYLAQMRSFGGDLFLNVGLNHVLGVPGHHGWYFEEVLYHCGLGPERIVLDLPARAMEERYLDRIQAAIESYRARGFRVALESLGSMADALTCVHRLRPEIIKLDVRVLLHSLDDERERFVSRLAAAEDAQIEIIVTGIETIEESRYASQLPVDLTFYGLQGQGLGAPNLHLNPPLKEKRAPCRGVGGWRQLAPVLGAPCIVPGVVQFSW